MSAIIPWLNVRSDFLLCADPEIRKTKRERERERKREREREREKGVESGSLPDVFSVARPPPNAKVATTTLSWP